MNVLLLCCAGKRLERRLREGNPVGGEGGEFGEGLSQKLVPLHGGGAAQVVGIVPFVYPDQLIVLVTSRSQMSAVVGK